MVNTQTWLDLNYPQSQRKLIRELYIRDKNLEGELDLKEFVNLERIDCSFNQLTTLKLTNLKKLKRIDCNDNYLTNFDYGCLSDELIFLDLASNNLAQQDLTVFSHLINLRVL